jgi:hypothetical protein
LERDYGFIPETVAAARLGIDRLYPLYSLYTFTDHNKNIPAEFAFYPKSIINGTNFSSGWSSLSTASARFQQGLYSWNGFSKPHAAGNLEKHEVAAFHRLHGFPPTENIFDNTRINPDADDKTWVKIVPNQINQLTKWEGGAARGWPGGMLFLPRPVFTGEGKFENIKIRGGDAGGLEMPHEHPHEGMAYDWQRLTSAENIRRCSLDPEGNTV